VLTSLLERDGFAVVRKDVLDAAAGLALADGSAVEVVTVPELARPIGRP